MEVMILGIIVITLWALADELKSEIRALTDQVVESTAELAKQNVAVVELLTQINNNAASAAEHADDIASVVTDIDITLDHIETTVIDKMED